MEYVIHENELCCIDRLGGSNLQYLRSIILLSNKKIVVHRPTGVDLCTFTELSLRDPCDDPSKI